MFGHKRIIVTQGRGNQTELKSCGSEITNADTVSEFRDVHNEL